MLFSKKKIINQSQLDLRNYAPKELEKIDIINASLVILPEHPGEELMTAYSNVKIKNIASTIYLPDNRKIASFNGTAVLSKETIIPDAIHMINGLSIIKHIESDKPIEIMVNGLTIYGQNTKLNFLSQNGLIADVPFEINYAKIFGADTKIDSLFIENLSDGTVIAAGNDMIIYNDVTLDLLKSKQIYFASGHKIKCDYSILGYIQTIATAGNRIEVNG